MQVRRKLPLLAQRRCGHQGLKSSRTAFHLLRVGLELFIVVPHCFDKTTVIATDGGVRPPRRHSFSTSHLRVLRFRFPALQTLRYCV